jgi:signal peptidase I
MYNGNLKKGIILNIILVLAFVISFILWPSIYKSPEKMMIGMGFGLIMMAIIWVYAAVDSYKSARNIVNYEIKPYNKWYYYCLFLIVIGLLGEIERSIVPIKSYKFPSMSMEPTLRKGDHIFADKKAYNNSKPQRGDVIVFEFPEDKKKDFVKRIIGLPGDTIEIKYHNVILNGEELKEKYIQYVDNNFDPIRDVRQQIKIPNGKYYVLGDNRDKSYDSRFWGFVDDNAIKGRLMFVYYSKDPNRILEPIK